MLSLYCMQCLKYSSTTTPTETMLQLFRYSIHHKLTHNIEQLKLSYKYMIISDVVRFGNLNSVRLKKADIY